MSESLKILKETDFYKDLSKTFEGKDIAKRILSLSSELDNLNLKEKIKFNEEFGTKFVAVVAQETVVDEANFIVLWPFIFLVIFAVALLAVNCSTFRESPRKEVKDDN